MTFSWAGKTSPFKRSLESFVVKFYREGARRRQDLVQREKRAFLATDARSDADTDADRSTSSDATYLQIAIKRPYNSFQTIEFFSIFPPRNEIGFGATYPSLKNGRCAHRRGVALS